MPSDHTRSMIVQHYKAGVVVQDSDDKEKNWEQTDDSVDDILNFIPDEILANVDEETLRVAESLLKENIERESVKEHEQFGSICQDFPHLDDNELSNVLSNLEIDKITVNKEPESDGSPGQQAVLTSQDYQLMLNHLRTDKRSGKPEKWTQMDLENFTAIFVQKKTVEQSFQKIDLRICIECIIPQLKEKNISYGLSWSKYKLVALFHGLANGDLDSAMMKTKKTSKKTVLKLRDMCTNIIQSFPKLILCSIYAEHIWPDRKTEWKATNIFADKTVINGLNENISWFSKPEVITFENKEHVLFCVIDAHHKLCSLRVKVCSYGLQVLGIQKQAWIDAARSDTTQLSLPLVLDLIDKQNNAFALRTFGEDVENFMKSHNYEKEANLCNLIRNWYRAEDKAGIQALERVNLRLNLLNWLKIIGQKQLEHFPPPGKYISDIPAVLWEGLIITIERKLQLYPFCSGGSYNSRATGTLEVENLFQSFQELDPAGKGVLKPDDVPAALGTAIEVDNYRLNPDRPFFIRTTASSVYPIHPLDMDNQENIVKGWKPPFPNGIDAITPLDHFIFDNSDRKKSKPKRKKGDVSIHQAPSRGESGVRKYHRRDESLILPHLRHGFMDIPDV
ncbi:uncharacterized protein LOC127739443 [Mytilus californianus]|uniref:uncharacterized protein LOC127739443 n=1 Tax=Mytilus californianus TaxID=6549 RepID=UPI002247ECC6|nr:uncharacterized protein LOC127739443 [Mytilus californianus]